MVRPTYLVSSPWKRNQQPTCRSCFQMGWQYYLKQVDGGVQSMNFILSCDMYPDSPFSINHLFFQGGLLLSHSWVPLKELPPGQRELLLSRSCLPPTGSLDPITGPQGKIKTCSSSYSQFWAYMEDYHGFSEHCNTKWWWHCNCIAILIFHLPNIVFFFSWEHTLISWCM